MRIRITLLDMADPFHPTQVALFITDTESLKYPVMTSFPLPASVDARTQHPYALVVEECQ